MTHQRTRFDEQSRSSRRPGIIPGRRFALAAGLAGVLVLCSSGAATANNSSQLLTATIYPPGGGITTESIPLSTLESSSGTCPTYTGPPIELYRQDGTQAPETAINDSSAWPLASVLACIPTVDIAKVAYVVVEESGPPAAPELDANSQLFPSDLSTPTSDFLNPAELPVVFTNQYDIFYERPRRTTTDANAPDQVVDQDPTPFMFEVFERNVNAATVTPSANPVAVGATVSFSVSALGIGPGASYSWDFDGAAPDSTAANPSVTYVTAGAYTVTAQVSDAAGDVAQSTPLTIEVGPATTQTTPTSPSSSPTGPTNSNGSTPGGSAGKPTKQPTGKSGKGKSGRKPPAGKSKPAHKSTGNTATTPASGGTSTGSGASGAGSSAAGSTSANHQPASSQASQSGTHTTTHVKQRSTGTTGSANFVTGRLISDVTPLAPGVSPLVHAVTGPLPTAPARRLPVTASIVPALAAGLAVFMLFSLGAGRELRWRRPWRLLRFGS